MAKRAGKKLTARGRSRVSKSKKTPARDKAVPVAGIAPGAEWWNQEFSIVGTRAGKSAKTKPARRTKRAS